MLLHVVLLGFCWYSFGTASDPEEKLPGIVLRLSPSAMTFATNYGAKYYLERYIRDHLGNTTDTGKCLGIFDICSLKNFVVKNYNPPSSNVIFKRGTGIAWNLTGAELDLGFDFELKMTDESTSVKGDAHVVLSGLSMAAEFAIGKDMNDSLSISLTHCSVDVKVRCSDLNETWDGNVTTDHQQLFYKKIRGYLQDTVYESVNKTFYGLARDVASIPERIRLFFAVLSLPFGFIFDTRLVAEPILEPDILEIPFRGEFRVFGDEPGPLFRPRKLDLPPPTSSMAALYLSEYTINTMYIVIFKKGWLSANITKYFLPPTHRHLFDTTCETVCLGTIFPQVAAKYPNVSATFEIIATSPPLLNFSSLLQRSHIESAFNIIIPGVNGSEASVAKLSMSVEMSKTVFNSRDRVMGRVHDPNITVTDNGSPKEFAVDVTRFNYVLQLIADFILVPVFNYWGAIGWPLGIPFTNIRFVRSDIRYLEGAFAFSADLFEDTTPHY